jgi:threonine dehydratase
VPDIGTSKVLQARRRIETYIRETPVLATTIPTPSGPRQVVLKLEFLQVAGSFKARGMFNAVLRASESGQLPSEGVVIASGGNAGLAVTIAADMLGVPATVFVPVGSPEAKLERLRRAGAVVVRVDGEHPESNAQATEFAKGVGALRLHAYDQDDVLDGAGTIALEILEQAPLSRTIVVAVGGGGLIGGVCRALGSSEVSVVAVEPTGAPTLHEALGSGTPVDVAIDTIARDSLGAVRIGQLAFESCLRRPVQSVLVTDQQIRSAQSWLWDEFRLLVEHSAAAVIAAAMFGAYLPSPEEHPVLVLCGANVPDPLFT